MDPALFGDLVSDPSLPVFEPERRSEDLRHMALRCPCGSDAFRLAGWPRIAAGRGGFFWRSLTRVWREARLPMEEGEPAESPFRLPVFVRCAACDRERSVFDAPIVVDRMPEAGRRDPRESYRCRVCRGGVVELVAGVAIDAAERDRVDVELVARCRACHRQSRVAWSHGRPSEQEVRLDLLYGRR